MQRKKKKNLDIDFTPSKINSKWIMDLNVQHKTIKLQDNIEDLDDLVYNDTF